MGGTLYVVATPIGNLGDISLRAVEVLRSVHSILCEDTRVTRKLLGAHQIERPLIAFHAHSGPAQLAKVLQRLDAGEDLALVSDAGTPLLSDPGGELVSEAIARGHRVVPIPGANALLAALVGSGLPAQPFVFLGFLPRARKEQREILAPLARLSMTIVLYEAPSRIAKTLGHLAEIFGPSRPASVARELTKKFETFERGTLEQLEGRFQEGAKGEIVVVVGPAPAGSESEDPSERQVETEARRLLEAGTPPSEAAKTLAGAFGLPKKEAYQVILRLSERSES